MMELNINSGQEQALARLKCAHCLSLVDYEAMALSITAGLRRSYRIDPMGANGAPGVTDSELAAAVQEAIHCFLRGQNEPTPLSPAA